MLTIVQYLRCVMKVTIHKYKNQSIWLEYGIWNMENDMRLNYEKCKEMIIDFSRNYSLTSGIQSVTIGEHVLERAEHAKMLGVTISNNLTGSKHVDSIVSKAGKRVYMLYQLKRAGISHNDLDKISTSTGIRMPCLEYNFAKVFIRCNWNDPKNVY